MALLSTLIQNPLEAWTEAHFNEPIVMGGLPLMRVAVVSEPSAIRRVLLDNCDNYKKDWLQRRILSAGLNNGLLTAETNQWRRQRRMLAPLFARRTVGKFSAAMVEAARASAERLRQQRDHVVDLAVEVTRASLDVLERTIFTDGFGGDPEDIRMGMSRYFEAIGQIDPLDVLGVPTAMPRLGRFKARSAMRLFEQTIDAVIEARRWRIAHSPETAPQDLLTLLLQAEDPQTGYRLNAVEVRSNVLTFLSAGHETTANSLTWALFLLSQSPLWRDRVRAEAERELDGSANGLAERLTETRAVIEESNRLYPPIAAISRSALAPDNLAGHAIKRGTMIVVAPYVLHRHRSLWSAPERFDPTRFLGNARNEIPRFAYIPFGAGPRTCIGATFAMQEACIVLATLVRHFRFEPLPKYEIWPQQRVSLRPKNGLPMLIRPWP